MALLEDMTQGMKIQRFDVEDGHVQFRANVAMGGTEETTALMSKLRTKLPDFQVSYVNLDTLL